MSVALSMLLYLTSAATSFALAFYGWRRWQYVEVKPFVALMAAIAFWSFCHALSVGSSTFASTLFWAQVQYAGIVLVGPLWLLYALAYADHWNDLTWARCALLFIIPVLCLIAVLTNSWHRLWWPTFEIDTKRAFSSLTISRGPFFWVHAIYGYLCVVAGLWIFIRTMITAPPFYQHQARLAVIGALFPVIGNILHLAGLQLQIVDDPTPFLFVFSGLTFYYATIRYHLLDLMPIAQREVFENIPDGVVVLDPRHRVLTYNAAAPRLLALHTSDWTGQSLVSLTEASPLSSVMREVLEDVSTPASRHATYASNEGLHGMELRVQPVRVRRGMQAGSLLLLRDTTERVRAERVLDQRLAELLLLNQTAQAINAAVQTDDVLRVITSETMRALQWDRMGVALLEDNNVTFRVIIDHPPQDMPNIEGYTGDLSLLPFIADALWSERESIISIDDPAVAGTAVEQVMLDLHLRTMVLMPLRQNMRPIGVLIISSAHDRDVLPDELRLFTTLSTLISEVIIRTSLYEEAQRANEVKSIFLASVSHELRTPLTSILGFTEMIELNVFGPVPDRMREPIEHIHNSSQVLYRLINDLLDFSRLEAGHLNIELFPVTLGSIVQAVAGAMQPQVQQRGLTLCVEVPYDLPLVRANSMRLEQVITNLLANAIKFTEQGSIHIMATQHEHDVCLSIHDTGIGIAPEHQQDIFQAFRQIESLQTRRFGGAGLGLAISRRLVELMGGTLTVESTPGVGSVFFCTLPIAHEQHLAAQVGSMLAANEATNA